MNYKIARVGLHMWEEPVISGNKGSGTIFFSGCRLRCVYCQNYEISHTGKGIMVSENQLIDLMLKLQQELAHNINLVTPSHYIKFLPNTLETAKKQGLKIPVVYNTSGYDKIEDLKKLAGLIDIYLPDLKYFDNELGKRYSSVTDYFDIAGTALKEMRRQCPNDIIIDGIMKSGVIVRHLALPNHSDDSKKVLKFLSEFDKELYISLMAQYFPTQNIKAYPELNRRLTQGEYDDLTDYFFSVGLKNGFSQDLSSGIEDYVPDFDLEKLKLQLS